MSVKRIPKLIDCDRLWADGVTLVYRILRKPRVTPFPPPLPKQYAKPAPEPGPRSTGEQ